MTRIIPWTLPPVKGGSIGGYTPQPTPEPVSNDPYDLSDVVLSMSYNAESAVFNVNTNYWATSGHLNISGVKILNTVEVASVIALVEVSGTLVYGGTSTMTKTIGKDTYRVDLSSVMTPQGGSSRLTGFKYYSLENIIDDSGMQRPKEYTVNLSDTSGLTANVVSITAYNANGVPLQEWMPE